MESRTLHTGAATPDSRDTRTYVLVDVRGARYCLDVARVREIVQAERVTAVPGAPALVRGVVNVRGRVLVLADLGIALGEASPDARETVSALVLDLEGAPDLALAVDEVVDVLELPHSALRPPPAFGLGGAAHYAMAVAEVAGDLAVSLDLEALLGSGPRPGAGDPGDPVGEAAS